MHDQSQPCWERWALNPPAGCLEEMDNTALNCLSKNRNTKKYLLIIPHHSTELHMGIVISDSKTTNKCAPRLNFRHTNYC